MKLPFRLLNVFSIEGEPFSGNPLCVITEAASVTEADMQSWARQFNLSESTFVTAFDVRSAAAAVRIFTPAHEMPFAGHPTLGTAYVVAEAIGTLTGEHLDRVTLHLPAGPIPVTREGLRWVLQSRPPTARDVTASPAQLAEALGLSPDQLVPGAARWIDCGVEQLIVQLRDSEAVRACRPTHDGLTASAMPAHGNPQVYVWAETGPQTAEARFYFTQDDAVLEDPATGSACANLGGWFVTSGRRDVHLEVSQGTAVGRPSRLSLRVTGEGDILVGGRVREVGAGHLTAGH
ncbi:MAG TPA: PhzF family phenazine biosynthesis protein [Intrasporangium sp.]|uniref:PhzF family phenazine biosynthesis protein n=1 Tax=Intrasporangium sp. TaxID=1925024 RepID=UPI002D769E12|nr:PhzF family phenazine biosynthesis protein [Intrasporangium sp.]HET7397708.1 PhzF family phenazine biosynthesis protein [Intrasporangium sp.]